MTSTASRIESYLEASEADGLSSEDFARFMDRNDRLAAFREEFKIPTVKSVAGGTSENENDDDSGDCIYFCGNSLGLQCKSSTAMVQRGLATWAEQGVLAWFRKGLSGSPCWTEMEELGQSETNWENTLASLVGGKGVEVGVGGSLTQNLNSLLLAFYEPRPSRHKILIEAKAFPSDQYAVENQIRLRGYEPCSSLTLLHPRQDEYCLRTQDVLDVIEKEGASIALILLPGIQYYTGQLFDIKEITAAAHSKGCCVGWDLAHAIGNVELSLHDWNVDFAVWCSYKYLNSGPGAIGGLFLHEKYAVGKAEAKRLAGWWALDLKTRFEMEAVYRPRAGASGFIQSTPDILSLSALLGSLQLFHKTSMAALRRKSVLLTGYLESLLKSEIGDAQLRMITPQEPEERGCQLSLLLRSDLLEQVHQALLKQGVVVDERNPDCIRVAPAPLYSSFQDVRRFVLILKNILESIH